MCTEGTKGKRKGKKNGDSKGDGKVLVSRIKERSRGILIKRKLE